MPSSPPVYFHFLTPVPSLRERFGLKKFLAALLRTYRKPLGRLDYVFCDDVYLLKINRKHLGHDFYTDIITFNLAYPSSPIEAEIYISVPRVKDNAVNFDTSFKEELHRVVFHGALHLAGFSDKSKRQKVMMRNEEDRCLRKYFN